MKITRNAVAPSQTGRTPDYFTGDVRLDNVVAANPPGRVGTALVTFAPGARTVWHIHPAGQTIIVTAGRGWAQCEGGPREVIHPGDTVVFDAGERHWHGATADTGMSHIAITESVDGAMVTWLEPVSDDAYRG